MNSHSPVPRACITCRHATLELRGPDDYIDVLDLFFESFLFLYPINHSYMPNHASRPRGFLQAISQFVIPFLFVSFSRSSRSAIQLYLDNMTKCWDLMLEKSVGLFGFLGAAGESNHLHLCHRLITLSMLQGHILAKVIARMRVHARIMNKEAV